MLGEVEEALICAHKLQLRKEAYAAARERELSYMTPAALAAIRAELQGLVEKGHITAEKLVSAESAADLRIGEKTYCFVKGHWLRGELYKRHHYTSLPPLIEDEDETDYDDEGSENDHDSRPGSKAVKKFAEKLMLHEHRYGPTRAEYGGSD